MTMRSDLQKFLLQVKNHLNDDQLYYLQKLVEDPNCKTIDVFEKLDIYLESNQITLDLATNEKFALLADRIGYDVDNHRPEDYSYI